MLTMHDFLKSVQRENIKLVFSYWFNRLFLFFLFFFLSWSMHVPNAREGSPTVWTSEMSSSTGHCPLLTSKVSRHSISSKILVYHLTATNTQSPTLETSMTCPLIVVKECQTPQLDLQRHYKIIFISIN